MTQNIDEMCKKQGCTRKELIKSAISKMLFEEFIPTTEQHVSTPHEIEQKKSSDESIDEIPLDKIVSVRYTLDDGKIIHILRGKKMQ